MSRKETASAFAPASIGNIAVGFDMLGVPIVGAGDRVDARRTQDAGITVAAVHGLDGENHPELSTVVEENTASIAAAEFWKKHGDGGGIELVVHKGVPLQSGMGSSAASAVAAVVAVNELLETPLDVRDLLPFAIEGEKYASKGLHADNVAPSLIGGMVFCPSTMLPNTVSLNVPDGVCSVLLHPEIQINTAEARGGLARSYSMEKWVTQQGYLGGFIAACEHNDIDLMASSLKDIIIEPQRSVAVPCFDAVKSIAMERGALGCSLSGSGPSIFALCRTEDAARIAAGMEQECRNAGFDCQSWTSPLNAPGAKVEHAE